MEDTLREEFEYVEFEGDVGLNPCFNGRYSQSIIRHVTSH